MVTYIDDRCEDEAAPEADAGVLPSPKRSFSFAQAGRAPGKEKADAHRDEGCVDSNTCSPE
jgi:hypothetical protein